jgi:hypothetical protein
MKNTIKFMLLLFLSISFSACNTIDELIDELTEEEENMYFEFPVNIGPTEGVWANYNFSDEIDIKQWMGEWYDDLQSIKIVDVSYQIINFQAGSDVAGKVKAKLFVNTEEIINESEYVVSDAYGPPRTTFQANNVDKIINKSGKIKIDYSGSALCGEGGLHFTVKVTVTIKAKYKI